MKLLWIPVLLVLFCLPAFAQVEELEVRGGPSTCGTCFNTAILSLKQLAGVSDATGDAREGWIKISVNPKQGISIKDAFERVRLAGLKDETRFTLKAAGTLERRGDRMVLVVPNQKEVFVVDAGERGQMAANAASSQERVWTAGSLKGSGNQYDLKIEKLQKQ